MARVIGVTANSIFVSTGWAHRKERLIVDEGCRACAAWKVNWVGKSEDSGSGCCCDAHEETEKGRDGVGKNPLLSGFRACPLIVWGSGASVHCCTVVI